MQGTADLYHHIADALLPEADPIFHNATALHTTVDMLDAEPPLVERLVGSVPDLPLKKALGFPVLSNISASYRG